MKFFNAMIIFLLSTSSALYAQITDNSLKIDSDVYLKSGEGTLRNMRQNITPEAWAKLTNETKQFKTENGDSTSAISLGQVFGNIVVDIEATTDSYEVYFYMPIAHQGQVPIIFQMEHERLIDYRFIHLTPPNIVVAARFQNAPENDIEWDAYLINKENIYSDMPNSVPMPTSAQLPDSVKQWLLTSDCVQHTESMIIDIAETVRDTITDLIQFADSVLWDGILNYVPGGYQLLPFSCDAYYAFNWGGTCANRTHAAVALFRANSIPARSFLNVPFDLPRMQMHWKAEYFIPDYGWVPVGTTWFSNPDTLYPGAIMYVVNPEDEFPLRNHWGVELYNLTSDPAQRYCPWYSPSYGSGHFSRTKNTIVDSTDQINRAHALTKAVFDYYTHFHGIKHWPSQQEYINQARSYQNAAVTDLKNGQLQDYIEHMQLALEAYESVSIEPINTIFFDNFESGINGWTHGGEQDEWELGTPNYNLDHAYSGSQCWGTDLDNVYENNADNWLMSPAIDLTNFSCAYVSFRIWNWVHEDFEVGFKDYLWMDITTDGLNFSPLCSCLGGVNDLDIIPDVGGWNRMVLDLYRYIGNTVQIRFRFRSDSSTRQPGSYIDDFHVYGRASTPTSVDNPQMTVMSYELFDNYPNPFNPSTTIEFHLSAQNKVTLKIFNILGEEVTTLVSDRLPAGKHRYKWEASHLSSGIYLYRLEVDNYTETKKMIFIR